MEKDIEAGEPPTTLLRPSSALYRVISLPPPPPPPKPEGYTPSTRAPSSTAGSTRRLSYSTTASTTAARRTIKYATVGRFAGTELSPQPSDDPADPLNWPQWKKELNLAALLLPVALTSAMKTIYIPVNNPLATAYAVPYSSAAALTAVPLVVSAFSGLLSVVASKVWGKRPVYLVSLALMFIGSMWGMRTLGSFREGMAARVFQGLGWGAFDTLVLGSIYDTYFEHERNLRTAMYNILSAAITWGAPLFGGLATRNASRFTIQYEIINAFFAVSVPLLILAAPETTYDHAWSITLDTPLTTTTTNPFRQRRLIPRGPIRITKEDVLGYLKGVKFATYEGGADLHTLLQAPRASAAPTTVLLFLVTFLPFGALWGFSGVISRLFTEGEFALSEAAVGSVMAGPFMGAAIVVSAYSLYKPFQGRYKKLTNASTIAAGSAVFFAGLLAFGLKASQTLLASQQDSEARFNYALLSFLLGMVAAGAYTLNASVAPLILHSSQYTSSSLYSCLRNASDMAAGVSSLRVLFSGIILQAVASAVEASADGAAVARNAVGLGCGHVLVAAAAGAVWFFFGEGVRRWDGRVMGLVDLSMLKRTGSFFEHD